MVALKTDMLMALIEKLGGEKGREKMRRIAPLLSQRAWRALAFSVPLATGLGGYVAYCEKQQPPSLLASPSPSSKAINDTVTNAQRFDVQYPEAHKALTDLLGERYFLDEQVLVSHE